MILRPRACAAFLALAALALAFGACQSDERYDPVATRVVAYNMREYIELEVSDPSRSRVLVQLIDQYEDYALRLDRIQQIFLAEVAVLNSQPDASRAQMRGLLERALRARHKEDEALLDTLLALRERTTSEEWARLMRLERDGLRATLRRERMVSRLAAPEGPGVPEWGSDL